MKCTRKLTRIMLSCEAAAFAVAALVHSGIALDGYEHPKAAVAETAIAMALLAGAAVATIAPARARTVGLAAQAFALLGTLVGVVTIAIGVGPRTAPDIAYHLLMLPVLAFGLAAIERLPRPVPGRPPSDRTLSGRRRAP